ncbi:LLM class flavin-dependent oxidoreductase [Pseudomonas sp. S31]|uniref:LLM class flavin-dependent oxidoreductase n=1 Tax=Pseudomonas sp. S31 TaxID=1564473 RepID=UPI001914B3B7|nr:LLM class flavin-dependent oxidoreductase [Pseudomonas sp. S31]MBK4999739.1 LLM class flavin-dependent oxidoreductase [Pseudomonas sp. S31]
MAIELRGRLGMGRVSPAGKKPSAVFSHPAVPEPYQLDPAALAALAASHERNGLDAMLIAQNGSSADVWSLAAWSLAATRQIKAVISHRPGLQAPTLAARAFASLDQLSNGRVSLHVIQGSQDREQQRDGDLLDKSGRYRRSGEYIEIFKRSLTAEEPFDFSGEFYDVRQGWSQIRPLQQPLPFISSAGASDEGIDFAARHMDGYALFPEPLAQTHQLLVRVREAAARHGRQLRFWRDANFVLAPTDEQARAKVEQLAQQLAQDQARQIDPRQVESEGLKRLHQAARDQHWHDRALYTGLLKYGMGGPPFVGSPQTVAAAVLDYYDLGIEIFSVGYDGDPDPDPQLAAELLQRIRLGALERDRLKATA